MRKTKNNKKTKKKKKHTKENKLIMIRMILIIRTGTRRTATCRPGRTRRDRPEAEPDSDISK